MASENSPTSEAALSTATNGSSPTRPSSEVARELLSHAHGSKYHDRCADCAPLAEPPRPETIKENTMEHTTEMYDGLACCACGWSGFPDEVPAHKAEVDA